MCYHYTDWTVEARWLIVIVNVIVKKRDVRSRVFLFSNRPHGHFTIYTSPASNHLPSSHLRNHYTIILLFLLSILFICPRCRSLTGIHPIHQPSPPSQPVLTNAILWFMPCIAKGIPHLHRTIHRRRLTTNGGPDSNGSTWKSVRANTSIRLSQPWSWASVTPPTRWGMVVYG